MEEKDLRICPVCEGRAEVRMEKHREPIAG